MTQVAFSTSLGLVTRNGAPVDKFMELLRGSKVYAPTFDKKLPLMMGRNYGKANFPTKVSQSCHSVLAMQPKALEMSLTWVFELWSLGSWMDTICLHVVVMVTSKVFSALPGSGNLRMGGTLQAFNIKHIVAGQSRLAWGLLAALQSMEQPPAH